MKQRLQFTLTLLDAMVRAIIAVWAVKDTTVVWSRQFKTVSLTFHNHLFDSEKQALPTRFYIVSQYTLEKGSMKQEIVIEASDVAELRNKLTQKVEKIS